MPIDGIFLDTSSLRNENWPAPSAALSEMFQLALAVGVPVGIPWLVLTEARDLFLRETRGSIADLEKTHRTLRARLPETAMREEPVPDLDAFRNEYERRYTALLAEYGIATVELPEFTLAEALSESASHAEPFRDLDSGFRDSIIALSVGRHAVARGYRDALLVANDKQMASCAAYLRRLNIQMVSQVEDASKKLRQQLHEDLARSYEERVQEVQQALSDRLPEITAFLQGQLRVPQTLDGVLARIVRVSEVAARSVKQAIVGYQPEPVGAETQRGSAEIDVVVQAVVQPYAYPLDTLLPIGAEAGEQRFRGSLQLRDRAIDATVTLDFEVHRDETAVLQFRFTEAEIGDLENALVRVLARQRFQRETGMVVPQERQD